jgi:hypothetical protein
LATSINDAPSAAAATVETIATGDTDLDVSFIFHTFENRPGTPDVTGRTKGAHDVGTGAAIPVVSVCAEQ